MNTPSRVARSVLGLALVFATTAGVGVLAGPADESTPAPTSESEDRPTAAVIEEPGPIEDVKPPDPTEPAAQLGGLSMSREGYLLDVTTSRVAAHRDTAVGFRILDASGKPPRAFASPPRAIVVRRDLTGYHARRRSPLSPESTAIPASTASGRCMPTYATRVCTG